MVPRESIIQWGVDHPWQKESQIEQDLLLSQAMIEIANDPLLKSELVLRGGTAFHKLFLPDPLRYSEDLDYVRTTEGGIGEIMKALTSLGESLGYEVRTRMGMYPKVLWRFQFESDIPGKIKIEINTFERSPMMPLRAVEHHVNCTYCSARADILTFQPEELVATKLRALYQRKKGRDLYDLWLALTILDLDPHIIVSAFPAYMPEGASRKALVDNLKNKLNDREFCSDVLSMIRSGSPAYDPQEAGKLIVGKVLSLVQ